MAKKSTKNEAVEQVVPAGYVPALKTVYNEQIIPALMKQFSYTTVMQVPKLVKITINEGVGEASQNQSHDKKLVEEAAAELSTIVGQKAVLTASRKDISNFHLRKGQPIGVKVTLRATKMYEFLERLIRVSLPRMKEQIICPEIDMVKNPRVHGMEITFVTTAKSDEEAYALLKEFGLPFKKHNN